MPQPIMPLWKKTISAENLSQFGKNSLTEHLGIRIIEVGDDYVKGSMTVDHRTRQPMGLLQIGPLQIGPLQMGLLHGGASAAFAEAVAGFAAELCLDEGRTCVGLQINANHIRGVTAGTIYAVAKPIHIGRSTHVWDVRISDEQDRTVCVSRLTGAIIAI